MDEVYRNVKAVKPYRNAPDDFGNSTNNKSRPEDDDIQPLTTKNAVKFLLEGTLKYKVCRYCLTVSSQLSQLDEIFEVARKGAIYKVTLRDMISSVHPFKVADDPNFPDKVCAQCVESAISSYMFAQQCERAERALRNCFDDIYTKFERLDPLERPKTRGRPKLNSNYNVLYAEHENVVDYADPIINIINVGSVNLEDEKAISSLECPKCWQVLPDIEALLNHESVHPKSMWFSCRLCGQSFVKRHLYKRHIKNVHEYERVVTVHSNESFKCNECLAVSSGFGEHLQHLERHKFKTTFEHLIDRSMNRLCTVCLEKGTRMTHIDENIHMYGGYPGLNNEKSIHNIITATFPERKSYKYQELLVPNRATIVKITRRMDSNQMENPTVIYKDKELFQFRAPLILSTQQKDFEIPYHFTFSEPNNIHDMLTFNVGQNILSKTTIYDDKKEENKAIINEPTVANKILHDTITIQESMSPNDNTSGTAKGNDEHANGDPEIVEICKVCWIFNKPTCENCLGTEQYYTDNNIIVDTKTKAERVNKQDECQYCWLFVAVGECNYCKNILTKQDNSMSIETISCNNEVNLQSVQKLFDSQGVVAKCNVSDSNVKGAKAIEAKDNERKRKSTQEPFIMGRQKWKCCICSTNNGKDRQTCFCCDFDTEKSDSKVKFNFGLCSPWLQNKPSTVKEVINTVEQAKLIELNETQLSAKSTGDDVKFIDLKGSHFNTKSIVDETKYDDFSNSCGNLKPAVAAKFNNIESDVRASSLTEKAEYQKNPISIADDPMDIEIMTSESKYIGIENNDKLNPFMKDESMDVVYEEERTLLIQPYNFPTAMSFNATVPVCNAQFMPQSMPVQFNLGTGGDAQRNRKILRPVRRMANLGRK